MWNWGLGRWVCVSMYCAIKDGFWERNSLVNDVYNTTGNQDVWNRHLGAIDKDAAAAGVNVHAGTIDGGQARSIDERGAV